MRPDFRARPMALDALAPHGFRLIAGAFAVVLATPAFAYAAAVATADSLSLGVAGPDGRFDCHALGGGGGAGVCVTPGDAGIAVGLVIIAGLALAGALRPWRLGLLTAAGVSAAAGVASMLAYATMAPAGAPDSAALAAFFFAGAAALTLAAEAGVAAAVAPPDVM